MHTRLISFFMTALLALMPVGALGAYPASSELAGTAWQLVKIMSMDDSVHEPEDRTLYRMQFKQDGRVAILADCNRGTGSWSSESAGRLEFGPIASTKALCPPESLSEKYLAEFQWVRS